MMTLLLALLGLSATLLVVVTSVQVRLRKRMQLVNEHTDTCPNRFRTVFWK